MTNRNTLLLAALGCAVATAAAAGPYDNSANYNNPIGMTSAQENQTVNSSLRDANGNLTLTPSCTPQVRPEQRVSLILGGHEVQAQSFSTATSTPSFIFERLPPEKYWVRLRVDGVDSLLVKRNVGEPPRFTGPRIEVLP